MKCIFLLLFASMVGVKLQAQTDTLLNLDTAVVEYVVVYKDLRLEELNNRPAALKTMIENKIKNDAKKAAKDELPTYSPIKAGNKTVTGSIQNKPGFRVQIYNGNNRAMANQAKALFNKNYPNMHSYLKYTAPNYKVNVGDFEDKKDANAFLKKIIAYSPTACVIPETVTIKNIIVK
jgi:hypothetical protein